jgi:cytidylate kinase
MRLNIALYGRSGSGKTLISEYLVAKHGYARCSTGSACRRVCRMLFESESKALLNQVTDALKAIDENVWLRASLSDAPANRPLVLDSMRFDQDYLYLRRKGFRMIRVDASLRLRVERMRWRGQEFDPATDDDHRSEVELDDYEFDYRIDNEEIDIQELYALVDRALVELGQARRMNERAAHSLLIPESQK